MFESRRFVELRKQTFWTQFLSNESFGMGVFYTLNVFCIQVWPPSFSLAKCRCVPFFFSSLTWYGHQHDSDRRVPSKADSRC